MGAVSVQPLGTADRYSLSPAFTKSASTTSSTPSTSTSTAAADAEKVQNQFERVTYSSSMQRVSMMARFQQAAVQAGSAEGGETASVQAQQLQFDFMFESRSEELSLFRERTQEVADNLEGSQRSSYLAASQQVAARFQVSGSISSAALEGFASASEGLQDEGNLMDQLLGLTQQLSQAADDFMNQILGAFTGNVTDESQFSFEDLFQRLVNEFLKEAFPEQAAGEAGGTSSSQQASSMQLSFSFEISGQVTVQQGQVQQSDPIMFDLDGDGFELSDYQHGADFDILGKGSKAQVAFVQGGDAFLAIDRNGDGAINDGTELFGDQRGARNGYEELRKLDSNADGVINSSDADFGKLKLFKDNGNGATEAGELISLTEGGIEEISLNYREVDELTSGGNKLGQIGAYRRTDGTFGKAADAILNYVA